MNGTLDTQGEYILDSTCSFIHNFPKHASVRMDIRPEVKPDIVGDIRKTNFPDNTFDKIYCDPPHMIRKDPWNLPNDRVLIKRRLSGRRTPGITTRYGFFEDRNEWIDFMEKVNIEMFRILKPGGLVIFKCTFSKNSRYIKRNDLDLMTNFKVIDEKITKSKFPGSKNKVHYITFRGKG